MSEVLNVEKLFGENVFTLGKMQERLPKKAFAEVKRVMEHGGELDNATADVVAKTMKDWAVEHGATHYTHWFQPFTVTVWGVCAALSTVSHELWKKRPVNTSA